MSTIIVASARPRAGRTAIAAGLGALLASQGRSVQLARLRPTEDAAADAEDDARVLAAVPNCTAARAAVSEQDALVLAKGAGEQSVLFLEAPPGPAGELSSRLSARVVLVAADGEDIVPAVADLSDALAGVIVTRVPQRRMTAAGAAVESKGVRCLAVLPEDRLLAGPNVQEMSDALHASRLVERGAEDEAVEYVMLGPISADPGQPYFLQHGSKAVVNRFDKMDLHLAALATEPDCLILTGGQQPSAYLLDRVSGSDFDVTVLLSPDGTVRTVEVLDELFGSTRFAGRRKLARAIDLLQQHVDSDKLAAALA
jgi:BioD-like phosphotransacetylase family protein